MPRKPLIRTNEFPYHINCRTNNKEWFPIPLGEVWEIFVEELDYLAKKHDLKIVCFVLMSNHYHLVLFTPKGNIDQVMRSLNVSLSKRINFKAQKINRLFGGRYKWSVVKNRMYFLNVYRYVYQNPIRAKLCKRVSDYPFSSSAESIRFYERLYDKQDKLNELFENRYEIDKWLNSLPSFLENESIKKGLCKTEFKPVVKRNY